MRKRSKRVSLRQNRRPEQSNGTRANARQRDHDGENPLPYPGGLQWDQTQVEQLRTWSHPAPPPAGVPSERYHVFDAGLVVDPCVGTDLGISGGIFPAREQTPHNEVLAAPLPIQGVTNGPESQPRGVLYPNASQGSIQPSSIGGMRFEPRLAPYSAGGVQRSHPQHRQSRASRVPRSTWPATLAHSSHWPELPMPEGPNHGYAPGYPADSGLPASGDMTNVATIDPRRLHYNPIYASAQNSGDRRDSGNLSDVPKQYDEGSHPRQPHT